MAGAREKKQGKTGVEVTANMKRSHAIIGLALSLASPQLSDNVTKATNFKIRNEWFPFISNSPGVKHLISVFAQEQHLRTETPIQFAFEMSS